MKAVVWYASWQMECCGDPFAVGEEVAWTVEEDVNDEWFSAALGPNMAASITHAEEHHSDEERLDRIEGRVLSITGAWCAFGPAKPGDRVHVPLGGSARFVEVRQAGAADRETFADLNFNGWVVELELAAGRPLAQRADAGERHDPSSGIGGRSRQRHERKFSVTEGS